MSRFRLRTNSIKHSSKRLENMKDKINSGLKSASNHGLETPMVCWYHNEITKDVTPDNLKFDQNSFQNAILPILCIAQCFGVLPLSGLRSRNIKSLKFLWFSPSTLYAISLNLLTATIACISIYYMVTRMGSIPGNIADQFKTFSPGAVFYTNAAVSGLLFLRIAKIWPNVIQMWTKLELNMWEYRKTNLARDFKIISGIIISISIVEHLNSIWINIPSVFQNENYHDTLANYLKEYCLNSHSFIFDIVPYSPAMAIVILIVSNTATFTWNFQDLFLILLSYALTQRLQLLNNRLQNASESQTLRKEDWRKFRELYAELLILVKYVDTKVSSLVALSFLNNLYFICLQLLIGVGTNASSTFLLIYYYGGFFFMISRATAVTLITGQLHFYSKSGLMWIFSCPSDLYTTETRRLFDQLSSDYYYLSGLGFFAISRQFLLSLLGLLVTYEIVLLQFDDQLTGGVNSTLTSNSTT